MSRISSLLGTTTNTRKRGSVTKYSVYVTDDLFKRLQRLLGEVPIDQAWTAEMVADELISSIRLVNRITAGAGPNFKSGNWPQAMREWGDFLAMVETDEIAKERADHRITPTKAQISKMERAIRWQSLYLADHEGPRRVLRVWIRCKVYRSPFDKACEGMGWSRSTAYRARDRALFLIAIGLMTDGVQP